ncbi:MAG: ABC transporter ATP-binding protein [bacterium]
MISAISLDNVSKEYRNDSLVVKALTGINLRVCPGEFASLIGPSGCGKSTLLNLISGIDFPTQGKIKIDGEDISGLDDDRLTLMRRQKIGIIFQFFNLLPHLSARENVSLSSILAGDSLKAAREKAEQALSRVGLGDRLEHRPSQLSGGQMQRVAIARALVTDPSIILADEPTGNLDSHTGAEIVELLQSLSRDHKKTVLMATHNRQVKADRKIKIKDGCLF